MPLVRKPTTSSPIATPDAAQVLSALQSPNTEERWVAARAAGGVTGGIAALAAALRLETEAHVREALFTSLARSGTPASVEELVSFLRSDNVALRTGALDALRSAGAGLSGLLPRLLEDPEPDVRILSCELARGLPADEATGLLCALIATDPQVNVCAAAVDVLAEVGTSCARPALAQCAARFAQNSFLGFAVRIAIDRISSQSAHTRD